MYDLIIRNGYIIDGSGNPGFHADLAVRDGRIAAIGSRLPEDAKAEIDAKGHVVAPGFVDSHSHDDIIVESMPDMRHKLEQGVTSEVVGMCGFSVAPISDSHKNDGLRVLKSLMHEGHPTDNTYNRLYSDYVKHNNELATGPHFYGLIGHNTIRLAVMGFEDREPTPEELEKMKDYVRDAMEAGALGISLGMAYTPGTFSRTDELIALCEVAASYGGIMTLHMRYENGMLLEGVRETIEIARATGIRTVISHHKVIGTPAVWGMTEQSLKMIDDANAEGLDIYLDQYPYTAVSTMLNSILPPKYLSLGYDGVLACLKDPVKRQEIKEAMLAERPAEDIFFGRLISSSPSHPELNNVRLLEYAEEHNIDVFDLFFDVLVWDDMNTSACAFLMSEEDVDRVMRHPRTMIGTDGLMYPNCPNCHPRAIASFPRVLGYYVRERHTIDLVDAIRKMTGLPSMVYQMEGKGLLRTGMDADIVIFNPDTIIDSATFEDCFARCPGLDYVLVGGEVAVKDAVYQGLKNGQFHTR
ncbi:MAG: D-aminoacylase [Solobacterium sp.]|nr:D-aminoacylase [Solobacterium sp.]